MLVGGGAPGYYVTQVQLDKQVKRFALENTTHMLNHGPPKHLNRTTELEIKHADLEQAVLDRDVPLEQSLSKDSLAVGEERSGDRREQVV